MTDTDSKQSILDEEHLRLLSIGYLVSAIVTGLFSLLGLFYLFMGIAMGMIFSSAAATTATHAESMPPQMMGWLFAVLGGVFFVLGSSLAIAKYLTSKYLKQRTRKTFCQVVAGISCLSIPYGTALGVVTFVVLAKPSVGMLFNRAAAV